MSAKWPWQAMHQDSWQWSFPIVRKGRAAKTPTVAEQAVPFFFLLHDSWLQRFSRPLFGTGRSLFFWLHDSWQRSFAICRQGRAAKTPTVTEQVVFFFFGSMIHGNSGVAYCCGTGRSFFFGSMIHNKGQSRFVGKGAPQRRPLFLGESLEVCQCLMPKQTHAGEGAPQRRPSGTRASAMASKWRRHQRGVIVAGWTSSTTLASQAGAMAVAPDVLGVFLKVTNGQPSREIVLCVMRCALCALCVMQA